jgi:hypothetical protein
MQVVKLVRVHIHTIAVLDHPGRCACAKQAAAAEIVWQGEVGQGACRTL